MQGHRLFYKHLLSIKEIYRKIFLINLSHKSTSAITNGTLNVLGQFMGQEDHLTVTLGRRVLHSKHLSLS